MTGPSPLVGYLSAPEPLSLSAADLTLLLEPFRAAQADGRPLSLAILSRPLSDSTTASLLACIVSLLASPTTHAAGLKTLTALLQVAPPLALALLESPSLAQSFSATVASISSSSAKSAPEDRTALVELLVEAASISSLRAQVRAQAAPWLESLLSAAHKPEPLVQATAAVAVIKLRLGSEPPDESGLEAIGAQLASLYPAGGDIVLEGLSYLTLGSTKSASAIKSALVVPNSAFLDALLPAKPRTLAAPAAYTLATLFHHLTTYPPLAPPALPAALVPAPEARELVSTRNSTLLGYALLPTLATLTTGSPSTRALAAQIYLSLTEPQPTRPTLLAAGVTKPLRALAESSTLPPPAHAAAVQAIARLLITADPSLVFSPAPLHSIALLLSSSLSSSSSEADDLLRTFEVLLALTNIASLSGPASESLTTSLASIQLFLVSPNPLVQRAATELVCNLVGNSDGGIDYYVQQSTQQQQQHHHRSSSLKVLLALCASEDLKTCEAAAGAVAALVEASWVVAERVFGGRDDDEEDDKGWEVLVSLVASGEEGCWVRGWDWVRSLARWIGQPVEGAEHAMDKAREWRDRLERVRSAAEGQEKFEADESLLLLDRALQAARK